jgi:hypothetical protein
VISSTTREVTIQTAMYAVLAEATAATRASRGRRDWFTGRS